MNRLIIIIIAGFFSIASAAQNSSSTESGKNVFGKALVPDMIADASIQEIDGTFYCSATTDGMGHGLDTSGPPVLWKSKDFVHWSFDGTMYPKEMNLKYWAPSKLVNSNGKWYSYPTLNGRINVAVSDNIEGPYRLARTSTLLPENIGGIDAEIFIDDDGSKYIFCNHRQVARLSDDMLYVDLSTRITIPSKHNIYSEGPCFFKRNGIYYYLYTLGGDENYQYAYMMSKESPLGPWITPEKDIITTTNIETGTFGPGHGSVFKREKSDEYFMVFLEFGRRSTNRQTYVNRLNFNSDGTIIPVKVDMEGVGMLRDVKYGKPLPVAKITASSIAQPMPIRHNTDVRCQRTEYFNPEFAIDQANGSRWMAEEKQNNPQETNGRRGNRQRREAKATSESNDWLMIDLGKARKVQRSEIAFVRPTEGHAYRLEYSLDGQNWTECGGTTQRVICSPHIDLLGIKCRYLRVTILSGIKGVWEWQVY